MVTETLVGGWFWVQRERSLTALFLAWALALFVVPVSSAAAELRDLDPARTVYLDLPDGRVVIELNDTFAPKHAERFRALVRSGFYDGLSFYRVIDGFVVQGGDGSDVQGEFPNPQIEAEFERPWSESFSFARADTGDPFADQTGFIDGFAVGRDLEDERAWLVHCYGTVAMARNNGRDTASTDFYIVIGQAPRYLDRNMSIFGRVVHGMDVVQRIRRPAGGDGMIAAESERTMIVRARVAVDVPESERMALRVTDTANEAFATMVETRRRRSGGFFHFTPAEFVDVCRVPVATDGPTR